MGSLAAKWLVLFLGQVIDGVAVIAHADAPATSTPASQIATQAIGWIAGMVVTFIGGHLLRKHPTTPELAPTPVDDLEVNEDLAKASGEAAAKASKGPFPQK